MTAFLKIIVVSKGANPKTNNSTNKLIKVFVHRFKQDVVSTLVLVCIFKIHFLYLIKIKTAFFSTFLIFLVDFYVSAPSLVEVFLREEI